MSCGDTLIKHKDDLHLQWFNMQSQQRTDEFSAYLPKKEYDTIVNTAEAALKELQRCSPLSVKIYSIQDEIQTLKAKVIGGWMGTETKRFRGNDYYEFEKADAKQLVITNINKLANAIHLAGISLLKVQSSYCGCDVLGEAEELTSFNSGPLAYCQGTLKLGHKRGNIMPPGNVVEHRPGAASTHAALMKFEQAEDGGYDLGVNYTESGDQEWELRQQGVRDYLENRNLKCDDPSGLGLKCQGRVVEDKILEIALFISQLKDIDLLPKNCVDAAFDFIRSQAEELKQRPKEKIWNSTWDRIDKSEEVANCKEGGQEGDTEEERRRRRDDRDKTHDDRIMNYVKSLDVMARININDSRHDLCTAQTYNKLENAHEKQNAIYDECLRLLVYPESNCKTYSNLLDEAITEASKDLVQRCPPEPIMLGLAADLAGDALRDALSPFDLACHNAENQECIDALNRTIENDKAGIKLKKLL